MGKIEERLEHLKSDIEELRITADKSHVSHKTSLQYTNLLNELDLTNAKNIPILYKTSKNGISTFLEYLRDRVEIIRKISPKTAERLDLQINRHEELSKYLLSIFKNAKTVKQLDRKMKGVEFESKIAELTVNVIKVEEAVNSCYLLLLDSIDYFDGVKN